MREFINWCNVNNGFLTAILSAIGLLLSIVAIVVSIRTARLPYKKKLKLSSSIDIAISKNVITGSVDSEISGVSVNVSNIGFRDVNITYLGFLVKDKSFTNGEQKMTKINDEVTGTGIIIPTAIKTEFYKKNDLIYALSQVNCKAKVYLYALDTEGQKHLKRLGFADNLAKKLSIK